MYCSYCGSKIEDGAAFCSNCGAKVEKATETPATPETAPKTNWEDPAAKPKEELSDKSKLVGGLLGIFLGSLGVHNFYLGFTGRGVAQLLLSVLSLGFLSWVSAIWGLIEAILILTGNQPCDAKGKKLRD